MVGDPLYRTFGGRIAYARPVARLPDSQRRAVTASAAIVDLSSEWGRRHTAVKKPWQDRAWAYYKGLPEIRYPANFVGNSLSRFQPRIGVRSEDEPNARAVVPDAGTKPPIVRDAEFLLAGLQGPQGGISEIMYRYGVNMQVAGDGWLYGRDVGRGADKETEWEFLSIRELVFQEAAGKTRAFRDWDGSGITSVSAKDALPERSSYYRRFWRPHPEHSLLADAAIEALADDCERLQALNDSITSRLISRLAQAGILFLPSSLSIAAPPDDTAPDGTGDGPKDQFVTNLFAYMQRAITDRSGAAGSIPIVVRGPAEAGEKIVHITMDRRIDKVELDLRAETRQTIARGLDLPPEVQTGLSDASHWTSWSVMDSSFRNHLQPAADRFADGLDRVFLWPALKRAYPDTYRSVSVVMDGSAVVSRPNEAEDGRQLHDRFALSDRALRARSGVEEADAPDEDEYVRQLGRRTNNAYLATWNLTVQDQIDWDEVARIGSSEGRPGVGSIPEDRRPADSSDPAGAPGEGTAGGTSDGGVSEDR